MFKKNQVFVKYKDFEPTDTQQFQRLDPTPADETLTIEDWRQIPAIHYQELYAIIGKYQTITRLGRFAHPQLLLIPDGRTLFVSSQQIYNSSGNIKAPIIDPYGNYLGPFVLSIKDPIAICFPHLSDAASVFPGLEFTSTLRGSMRFSGRLIPNQFDREPTDFEPPIAKLFLFLEKYQNHYSLTISSGGITPLAPSTQFFLRFKGSTIPIPRRDLEIFDPLNVISKVNLPKDVETFDWIAVDHAGNQSLKRYRIVSAKGRWFLQEDDQKVLRDLEGYEIAVASMMERSYQVVDSGKISVNSSALLGDLLFSRMLQKQSGKVHNPSLETYLTRKFSDEKEEEKSPWHFTMGNPFVDLQRKEGAKLYSMPEIHEETQVVLSPFEFDFVTVGRSRYETGPKNARGFSTPLKKEEVDYILVRNWLNGDIVFQTEVVNVAGMDTQAYVKYYDGLSEKIESAVDAYRKKYGMQRGQPIPKDLVSKDKARLYPILIKQASGEPSQDLPDILKEARFVFHIVDTNRDKSLPMDKGTTDNPIFYYATGMDLKKRPIAIQGEVSLLEITIPKLLSGTKSTDKVDLEKLRDQYGNFIFVEEDKEKGETLITIRLKPQRSRNRENLENKFTTFDIDFSNWVPTIGEIKDIAFQSVQKPLAFIGSEDAYAVYSHFSEAKWRQAKHTLPTVARELTEMEASFGLRAGEAIESILFQDANEVNASVHLVDPNTVRIWDEMLDSFGNWEKVTRHEAAHSLDHYFKISQDEQWRELYNNIKEYHPNFFLFINESNFLITGGGHSQDNEAEFFASALSSLTHPNLLGILRQRSHLEPDRDYVRLYNRTLTYLLEVLYKKLPPEAPILGQIVKLRRGVGNLLTIKPSVK